MVANGHRIQGDYGALEAMARVFDEHSQDTRNLMQEVRRQVEELRHGGWIGTGAEAFQKEMQELVGSSLERLASALADGRETTLRICAVFHEAEEEACRYFENGSGAAGGAGGEAPTNPTGATTAPAGPGGARLPLAVSPLDYRDGVDGWQLVTAKGKFAFEDLVSQTGPTCTLYAPLNLLIMSGRRYTQDEADAIVFGMSEFLKLDGWKAPSEGDWKSWNEGKWAGVDVGHFPRHMWAMFAAEGASDKLDGGIFLTGGAKGSSVFDRRAAEKYLIESLGKGNPVLVDTDAQGIFTTGEGGHTYNIIGVKTDAAGRLTSVLASTNHDEAPFVEIPAATFMDAWGTRFGLHVAMMP